MNGLGIRSVSIHAKPIFFLQAASICLLFLLLYAPVFPGLVKDWYETPSYSHGFLIPFIVAYLLWAERERLQSIPLQANPWGALTLLLAVALWLFGKAIEESFTMRVSMVLSLAGLIHLFLGARFLKALRFPLIYLSLMIPIPYVLRKELTYYLRFSDAILSEAALQALGIPVYRESYFLHLPNITLEVADVCSGVSSIFALLALGALYSYFLPVPLGPKFALVLSTFPSAIVVNLFRIILTSALVYYFGPAMLGTLFHSFSGTLTFLFSVAMVVSFGEFLRRKYLQRRTETTLGAATVADPVKLAPAVRSAWAPFLLACAIFLSAFYLSGTLDGGEAVALQNRLDRFPMRLGPYLATEKKWPDAYEDYNAEEAVSRFYKGLEVQEVELYIGYSGSQRGEKKLLSPMIHFQKGWNYVWLEPARIETGGTPIEANWMLTQRGAAKRLVLYWYQARGRSYAGEFRNRFERVKNSIVSGRTDGAVIRIATPLLENEDGERAKEQLSEFSRHLYPKLVATLPVQ